MIIVIYTLIQIIIESLPISSSTHARIVCGDTCVSSAYDYFLHGFTVLVILTYFFKEYFFLLRHATRIFFSPFVSSASVGSVSKDAIGFKRSLWRLFLTTVIADCVTALFYFVLPYTTLPQIPVSIGLAITACALLSTAWFDTISRSARNHSPRAVYFWPPLILSALHSSLERSRVYRRGRRIQWPTRALIIGFVQGIALLPGISRMGSTYAAARWMGLRPYRALALSLLVQLPLIGAGFLKGLWKLYATGELAQYMTVSWLLLYAVATVTAYGALCMTMRIAEREKMWVFGLYVLCLIPFLLFM